MLTVPWLPEEASTQAGPIDTLYDVLAVISAFIFALVVSDPAGRACVHFRRRHNDLSDGEPIHGNTGLEVDLDRDPGHPDGRARRSTAALVLADIEETEGRTRRRST